MRVREYVAWPLRSAVTLSRYTRPLHSAVTRGRYTRPLHAAVTRGLYTRPLRSATTLSRYTQPLHLPVTLSRYTQALHSAATLSRYTQPLHSMARHTKSRPLHLAATLSRYTRPLHSIGRHTHSAVTHSLVRTPPSTTSRAVRSRQKSNGRERSRPAGVHRARTASSAPSSRPSDARHTPTNKPSECCEAIRMAQAIVGHHGGNGAVIGHRPDHHTAIQRAARKPLAPAN